MNSRDQFINDVDAFLTKRKLLSGVLEPASWVPSRDVSERETRLPIEVDNEMYGQQLVIVSRPTRPTMDFSVCLLHGVCVCRLDFDITGGHTNSLLTRDTLPMVVQGPHFHRWDHNKRFVEDDLRLPRLQNAESLPQTIHTFDSALRWFCDSTNIELPHGHGIELPLGGLI